MALVGLCDSYFPGLKPDEELGVMCQQAQVYKAGGELGQGDHSIVVEPSMDSYIPRKEMQGKQPFFSSTL